MARADGRRYVKNTFDPASASTIGASFLAKKVVVDDCMVRLQVSRVSLVLSRSGLTAQIWVCFTQRDTRQC